MTEDLRKVYVKLKKLDFETFVLKILYVSSGKGLRIVEDSETFQMLLNYIPRRSEQFELLLEGYHPMKQKLNCQVWVDKYELS